MDGPETARASFAGRVVLVTGAASGIGRATARLFAWHGAEVALFDVDAAGLEAVRRDIAADGTKVVAITGDASRAADCRGAVDRVVADLGGLDVLFNNAGIIRRATVVDTTEEEWDRLMAVNVKSMFLFSKHAIPAMIARGGGAIVNTASGWGLAGGARAAAYCASKGAVVQLTRAMAIDCGPLGIRVNCVCPGDTDTAMLRDEAVQLGEPPDQVLAEAARRPLGRVGRPEEIAEAVLFLAGSSSTFVTGTVLVVDGGGLAGTA